MPIIRNSAVIADLSAQRVRALGEHLPAGTKIGIGGTLYEASEVIAIYQDALDAQAALSKSRAQVEADLAVRRATEAKRRSIEFGLKVWVLNHLGADSAATKEIGFEAPRKGIKSAEVVANAVKLAKATREARGTMGKREKLKIKGTLAVPTAVDAAQGPG